MFGVRGEAGAKVWLQSQMIPIFVCNIYAERLIMCKPQSGSVSSLLGRLCSWSVHGNELVV